MDGPADVGDEHRGEQVGKGRKTKGVNQGNHVNQTQELHRPDVKMLDECGFETLEFKCWRCARTDHRSKEVAEAMQRNGKKLFCIGCERPDMFEWEVETLADGITKREYIRPLTRREMYNKISPEAHMLAEKQALAQTLRARAERIRQLTAAMEEEYQTLVPAIAQAEADVLEAERMVLAMEKDDVGKKIESLKDMEDKIKRLVSEIAEAQKNTEHQERNKQIKEQQKQLDQQREEEIRQLEAEQEADDTETDATGGGI